MNRRLLLRLVGATLLLALAAGCSAQAATPTGPGGTLVVNSQSIITAKIIEIESNSTGYPWRVDIQVLSSQDVENLPNPVKDMVGLAVITYTDQNVNDLRVGQSISAHVKLAGDVPLPGISALHLRHQASVTPG